MLEGSCAGWSAVRLAADRRAPGGEALLRQGPGQGTEGTHRLRGTAYPRGTALLPHLRPSPTREAPGGEHLLPDPGGRSPEREGGAADDAPGRASGRSAADAPASPAPHGSHTVPGAWRGRHQPAADAGALRAGDDQPLRALCLGAAGSDSGAGGAHGQAGDQGDEGPQGGSGAPWPSRRQSEKPGQR